MKVIKPSFDFEDQIDGHEILRKIERAGRTCYKSEEIITDVSAARFVKGILERGHESVIEHASVSVRVICDRGVSHEIVRHRLGSYSQESTRYCNYAKDKFGEEIGVIEPLFFDSSEPKDIVSFEILSGTGIDIMANKFDVWFLAMEAAEWAYLTLIKLGAKPQEARSVLPNSLKTEIVITYNLREWRHFFRLRCAKAAHPQMREITLPMLAAFKERVPIIFDDIDPDKL